jgi:predicted transcriptional regulator of viral defense system
LILDLTGYINPLLRHPGRAGQRLHRRDRREGQGNDVDIRAIGEKTIGLRPKIKIPHFLTSVVFLLYNNFMADDSYSKYKKIFAKHNGILRASTAIDLGVPKHVLYEMVRTGELVREAQGIYRLSDNESPGHPDLVNLSLRVPRAVFCLISALYFHELTTQIPHSVYFALPRDVKTPKIPYPPIRVFHFSQASYQAGIVEHELDGVKVKVKIYNREKTIADCFKFREKVGMDVAIEAVKDYLRQPKVDVHLLLEYAHINRVEKVMRPYLEALI